MAYEIEIPSSIAVESDNTAVIELDNPTADIIDNQDRSVDVYSCTYVVVCDDIYIKNYIAEIPAWMQTYIENVTNTALASTNTDLNNLLNQFNALQDGYTATIASVTTDLAAQNATITALVTSTDASIAGINTTLNTKIDETQALALIAQEIATFRDFGLTEASAWWQAIINTVVTEQQAQATNISTLNSGLNNNSASVSTLQSAVTTLDSAVAKASQYVTASVGGTTLITGFALVSSIDPAGDQISSMVFNAGDFRIYTTTTLPDDTATPIFQASGQDVWFTGKVTFQGLGIDSDTTTIDGGKLTANTVNANKLLAGSIWTNGSIQSSDFAAWTTGFKLKANAAGTFADPTIFGAYIRGGDIYGTNIESATLISSTINVKDLIVTTDADYTTQSIVSSPAENLLYDTVSRNWVSWDYSLYAYNNPTNTPRLAGTSARYQATGKTSYRAYNGNGTDFIDITYNGWTLLIDDNNTGTMNVSVKIGTTTIASATVNTDTTVNIAGINFRNESVYSDSTYIEALWIEPVGSVTGISGLSGKLNIYVTNAGAGNLGNPQPHYLVIHNL